VSETTYKKKLIEVALPLDEINAACRADKDRKTGTLRNIHKWFAPMPLPAWRALLFAALVDDPEDDNRRVYLLDLIKRLVSNGADLPDQADLDEAKRVLAEQFPDGAPTVMDPFCGGGSTLVEAQRLGMPTFGSDLNPVPALISRTLTETLPPLYGEPPFRPAEDEQGLLPREPVWSGYEGLIEDVVYYSVVVGDRARNRLAKHFPSRLGERPVAWIWGRTARCQNPACGVENVLSTSWWLSKKPGELAWITPRVVDRKVQLEVIDRQRSGGPTPESPKTARGANFLCVACGALIGESDLISQGEAGTIGYRLMAVAATVDGRRVYRAPGAIEEAAGINVPEVVVPTIAQPENPRWFSTPRFGFDDFASLYLPRQLLMLHTFAELVAELRDELIAEGARRERADGIVTLLGLAVGQLAATGSTQTRWRLRTVAHAKAEGAFGRNDIPMNWDFAETYFESESVGDWRDTCRSVTRALQYTPNGTGIVRRIDARTAQAIRPGLVATDPPYFDAIGYADLSDYFYMWHRITLRNVHPDLYVTLATPKTGELTAVPSHHGNSRDAARDYFIDGFTETFRNLAASLRTDLPMLVVYASKEQKAGREEETRWASILTAMVAADLEIVGTWPIHGTGSTHMIAIGTNSIATYIAMVVRPRPEAASTSSLADFNRALRRELGPAIRDLQAASILPVDLAQAAMGPGMQIFSRYRAVLDQGGKPVGVGQALRLINSALAEVLDEQEGELEPESRFAVRWWESYGWTSASFGEADKTARPLGISVDDVVRAQVATSRANKVQLLGSGQLDRDWRPSKDAVPTAWEAVHHLADRLIDGGGELEAARLMSELGSLQDPAMALAYRLHDIAAKKGRTSDQERYNALISSWSELIRLSGDSSVTAEGLF
jgi:putative DNA methylase